MEVGSGSGSAVGGRSAAHRAGAEEDAADQGAVGEAEFALGLQVPDFAAGVDIAVAPAPVGPFAADRDVPGDGDAGASREAGNLGGRPVAVDTAVDPFDRDRNDEGGGDGDRRVGVGEDGRVAALAGTVEEGDRDRGRDRRLFGELDDRVSLALADDRIGAGSARPGDRPRGELSRRADGEPRGLDRAVAVELEGDGLGGSAATPRRGSSPCRRRGR